MREVDGGSETATESKTKREGERELEREKLRGEPGDVNRGKEKTYRTCC